MAKAKKVTKKRVPATQETDSAYILKLALYLIVGAQWLWLERADGSRLPVPAGLIIGIIFAMHDHFRVDRKVEYALLLIACVLGYALNVGIFFSI